SAAFRSASLRSASFRAASYTPSQSTAIRQLIGTRLGSRFLPVPCGLGLALFASPLLQTAINKAQGDARSPLPPAAPSREPCALQPQPAAEVTKGPSLHTDLKLFGFLSFLCTELLRLLS